MMKSEFFENPPTEKRQLTSGNESDLNYGLFVIDSFKVRTQMSKAKIALWIRSEMGGIPHSYLETEYAK